MILQWKEFNIHLPSFNQFLIDNCPNTDGINASAEDFTIIIKENCEITQDEIDTIYAYYNSITEAGEAVKFPTPTQIYIANEVKNAINFGKLLMKDFIEENVLLGITQLGLTNHVRKTLWQVKDAIETGALYDAISELIIIDPTALDAQVLTEARILKFRNDIEGYLTVPLASTWNEPETFL